MGANDGRRTSRISHKQRPGQPSRPRKGARVIRKASITEMIADYAVETDSSVSTAVDAITEQFLSEILDGDKTLDPTYEEIDALSDAISGVLERFSEDAQNIIDEWDEDAREMATERARGLSGQY